MQTLTDSIRIPEPHLYTLKKLEEGYWWFQGRSYWVAQLLKHLLGNRPTTSLVHSDLGCGAGGLARSLQKEFQFARSILVDGHPTSLRLASLHGFTELVQADFTSDDLKLPTPVDVFTCMDVLEHLPNPEKLLKSTSQQASPGAVLVGIVPAHPFLFSRWDEYLGHYRRYSRNGLRALFQSSGWEIAWISYAWSFMTPAALGRKLLPPSRADFPEVSDFLNQTLFTASKWEWNLAHFLPLPFGTSLIVGARKK